MPFHRYSDYLLRRYGEKTYRVSIDAGFSCPVRDQGTPCTYCDIRGSRASYLGETESIEDQIARSIEFLRRRYRARRFLLYFQAFSNTYGPPDELRRIYDRGLSAGRFDGLIVSTRPDCIDETRAELLAEYAAAGLDVWVELGLQTSNNEILSRVRRGHTAEDFGGAVSLLKDQGILTAAHVMLGLPGEQIHDAIRTGGFLAGLGIDGVKFHNLVVVEGTRMYEEYLRGEVVPPSVDEYLEMLIAALENVPREVVVMRLTCDPPVGVASFPEQQPHKATFYEQVVREMQRRGTWQGRVLDNRRDQGVTYLGD